MPIRRCTCGIGNATWMLSSCCSPLRLRMGCVSISTLIHWMTGSSAVFRHDATSVLLLYPTCSVLTRQDLVSWKVSLDRQGGPIPHPKKVSTAPHCTTMHCPYTLCSLRPLCEPQPDCLLRLSLACIAYVTSSSVGPVLLYVPHSLSTVWISKPDGWVQSLCFSASPTASSPHTTGWRADPSHQRHLPPGCLTPVPLALSCARERALCAILSSWTCNSRLSACLPACPPACLPARLPACLPACIPACLPTCLLIRS